MKHIINKDKNGNVIKDLTQVKLPQDLEISIFKVLNPELDVEEVKFSGAS